MKTFHDESVIEAVLNDLDFAPVCEWNPWADDCPHPAEWVVRLAPRACGCPSAAVRLFSDPCYNFSLTDPRDPMCYDCGASSTRAESRGRILSAERL